MSCAVESTEVICPGISIARWLAQSLFVKVFAHRYHSILHQGPFFTMAKEEEEKKNRFGVC